MGEPIRVAHVMGKMVGGGLEAVVMNYYRHIDRSKVQFDFIVDEDSTLVPREEIESLGGRVFTVPPYQRVVSYQRALTKLFREQGWRIVHSHENALSVFPLRAAKRAGVPVRIAHSHSTSGKGEPARNAMKWVLRHFSNVYPTHRMACSRHAGEWLFGRDADFEVLYNAFEVPRFRFDPAARAEVRAELGIRDGELAVGHIGRFVPQKNQLFLLDVFAEVLREGTDAVLVLAGDGPQRPEVEAKAGDLGIAERVRFLGQRGDANRLYQAFDVFCLPSLYEGLGIVAVEAQAAGLPCVLSTEVPKDVALTDQCSFLNLEEPVYVWAKALKTVSLDRDSNAASSAEFEKYDITDAADILTACYLSLLGGCDGYAPSASNPERVR